MPCQSSQNLRLCPCLQASHGGPPLLPSPPFRLLASHRTAPHCTLAPTNLSFFLSLSAADGDGDGRCGAVGGGGSCFFHDSICQSSLKGSGQVMVWWRGWWGHVLYVSYSCFVPSCPALSVIGQSSQSKVDPIQSVFGRGLDWWFHTVEMSS